MKWFVYIFSLYITLLACFPCNDAAAMEKQGQSTVQPADTHEHNTSQDFCSPLCICSCCNIQIDDIPVFSFFFANPQLLIQYPLLSEDQYLDAADNIWQPPQLV